MLGCFSILPLKAISCITATCLAIHLNVPHCLILFWIFLSVSSLVYSILFEYDKSKKLKKDMQEGKIVRAMF